MEEDIIKAREEGIRMGAELAAMHGSDATSEELANAFFDGCEVGYKKASEELQPYIDLYKDLAEKAEKVAREVIDKYPKWISVTDIEHLSTDSNLVGYFGGGAFDQLRWYDFVWTKSDGTLISENREREIMNEHCIAVFKLPKPPDQIGKPTDLVNTLKCLNCQQDCQMIGCDMDACSSYKPPKESEKDG